MDILTERLDEKSRHWKPELADQVRRQITETIEAADLGTLDLIRSRTVEQQVLNLLEEPP